MSRKARRRRTGSSEAHVRLYAHEIGCPAWQSMGADARALLIELRALYQPSNYGLVFLSVREAQRRLNAGQRRVEKAFAELIERGWIRVVTKGQFSCKVKQATAYMLTNEAGSSPGAKPTKDYMRWQES